jgi:hypothetical protein
MPDDIITKDDVKSKVGLQTFSSINVVFPRCYVGSRLRKLKVSESFFYWKNSMKEYRKFLKQKKNEIKSL